MQQGLLLVMSAIIALCALLGGIGLIIDWRLETVKETQATIKIDLKDVKNRLTRLEDKIDLLLKTEKSASLKK